MKRRLSGASLMLLELTLSALIFLPFGGVALFFSTVLSGIPFDLLHCGGNFAIMLLCYRPLRRLLRRYGPPD